MTSLFAAFGFDPAWASVLNLVLLVMLHAQSKELARTAKGSERRAENAAAEITRLAAQVAEVLEIERHSRRGGPS